MRPWLLALSVVGLATGLSCVAVRGAGDSDDSRSRPEPPATGKALTEEVSYTNDIRPIVENFCTTCHSGADPDGGFALTSFDAVRAKVEDGELLARINDDADPMPPVGLMSKRQRALFEAWADGGFMNQGDPSQAPKYAPFHPPEIEALDISNSGFELLERLQGHWIGDMTVMGQDFSWFSWDYRAIAPAHVHAIFEGGTMGNLFTSFFVADFKGKRTIMARNGGILNGIYRTSYFILDRLTEDGRSTKYRLVDAYGGEGIMWMSLEFTGDELQFRSYTSRLGLAAPPKIHMRFTGKRRHPELAGAAAKTVGFPEKNTEYKFPKGMPIPDWGPDLPVTSYSYIWNDAKLSLDALARLSGDPIRIDQIPHLAKLRVTFPRATDLEDATLHVYLSKGLLTDSTGKLLMQHGVPRQDAFDGILSFPELTAGEKEMTFTYLHPGIYYVTVVAEVNGDGYPSRGDWSQPSVKVDVGAKSDGHVNIEGVMVRN